MDHARFADRRAHDVVDVRHGREALDAISREGFWAVVATFEGAVTAVRFATVEPVTDPVDEPLDGSVERPATDSWRPLDRHWHTSLDRAAYVGAVREVR